MKKLSKSQIREIFLANGFTIKEGESDLKQYVYDAATALLKAHVVCLKYYMDELIKAQAEDEHAASMTRRLNPSATTNTFSRPRPSGIDYHEYQSSDKGAKGGGVL